MGIFLQSHWDISNRAMDQIADVNIIKLNINSIFQTIMQASKKIRQIYDRKIKDKNANLTHVEQQVGTAILEIISHQQGENKHIASFLSLHKAIEIPNRTEKPYILIYVSYKWQKGLLTSFYRKLVMELEKKLKTIVLMVAARNIQSRWIKKNRTQKRPFSRTLTAVYESLLDELLLPGIIIGKKTRFRLDGSQYMKVIVDKSEQHFLEERVAAVICAYKKLTTRDIQIEFVKDPVFYTLKKGQQK